MKKKIMLSLGILLFLSLLWYLFLKPYDYLVTFKAKTFPAAVGQSISTWGKNLQPNAQIKKNGIGQLTQKFQFNDSTHIYQWDISAITDSTSKVKVYVTDVDHSLNNRLTLPFSETDFKKRTKKTTIDFTKKLNDYLAHFKVTVIGGEELKPTYCAYVDLQGPQSEKALGMMRNYTLLSGFIAQHNIQLNGKPFVEVTQWDKEKDSISYNFCYPIIKSDSLPIHPMIKYKAFIGGKALKAIYNGNYITSDMAWYRLLDHAKKNKVDITGLPVEVFFNNPNVGGNELEWKAEIYMPLKK